MARSGDGESARLDDAARAGWLYYVAGNTQDEIAKKLGVSRQSAQRLVSLAISERLIKVRLDHPIARCMELASLLRQRYDLRYCEIAPTDPTSNSVDPRHRADRRGRDGALAAPRRSRRSSASAPAARCAPSADQLPQMECPQHRLVGLVGTTKTDGSASFYDVIMRVSDTVRAPLYPMAVPVLARTDEERGLLISLPSIRQGAGAGRAG